jgi:translation initiation factor 3 subunit G
LPEEADENDLRSLFSPFGNVVHVSIPRSSKRGYKGFAFVTLGTRESAERAIQGVNGYGFYHLILKVDWALPPASSF